MTTTRGQRVTLLPDGVPDSRIESDNGSQHVPPRFASHLPPSACCPGRRHRCAAPASETLRRDLARQLVLDAP